MQVTGTEYNAELVERWANEAVATEALNEQLGQLLVEFSEVLRNKTQFCHFEVYVKGLLSNLERKSIEPIALRSAEGVKPRALQTFVNRSTMDDAALMALYQSALSKRINGAGGMLSVDESDFVKKGNHSAGVARQYCGTVGKTENCQAGVFVAYAGENGYGLVDRELYLPKKWFDEDYEERRQTCQIPKERVFETKNAQALRMIQAVMAKNLFDVQWVGCDCSFGSDREFLEGLPEGIWYFAAIRSTALLYTTRPATVLDPPTNRGGKPRKYPAYAGMPVHVTDIMNDAEIPWERTLMHHGAKGDVYADIKCVRAVTLRRLSVRSFEPRDDVWLVIRKNDGGEVKYAISNAPATLPRQALIRAASLRWPIEQCFEECKSYLGMSHYECRTYQGFNRHMLFVMIAHLFTTSLRLTLKKGAFQ